MPGGSDVFTLLGAYMIIYGRGYGNVFIKTWLTIMVTIFLFFLLCHCHCVRCKVVNDEQGCSQRQQLAPRNASRCHHTSPPLLIGGHHQSRSYGRGWFLSHIAWCWNCYLWKLVEYVRVCKRANCPKIAKLFPTQCTFSTWLHNNYREL